MIAHLAATFLLLQLLCQVLVTVECGCDLPSGYVDYPEYNTAYKFHEDIVDRDAARRGCLAEKASLAVLTSLEMIRNIETFGTPNWYYHSGVYRLTSTSDWIRADNGLTVTSIPLHAYDASGDKNCIFIYPLGDGYITNGDCDLKRPFVCAISTSKGCRRLVDPQDSQDLQGSEAGPKDGNGE